MERNEKIRQNHRPDWIQVFLGTTTTLASMGILTIVGVALRLRARPEDSRFVWVLKLLYIIGAIACSAYIGGFVTGATLPRHNRVVAAMDGMLVWLLTLISCFVLTIVGFSPLPGVVFTITDTRSSAPAALWNTMQFGVPIVFAYIFGAMRGNDLVEPEEEVEELLEEDLRPDEQEKRRAA
jgi:hypothetical protein